MGERPRERVAITFPEDEGRTIQSERDSTDINQIMKRFESTGVLEHVNEHQGDYTDIEGAVDYHTALNIQRRADEMFMELPAKVRFHFHNDPGDFLAATSDPARQAELIELGLLPDPLVRPPEPRPAEPPAEPLAAPSAASAPVQPPPAT